MDRVLCGEFGRGAEGGKGEGEMTSKKIRRAQSVEQARD
jgi:hypothetical protein